MSRTIKGSKGIGYEYWKGRYHDDKRVCVRGERRRAKVALSQGNEPAAESEQRMNASGRAR